MEWVAGSHADNGNVPATRPAPYTNATACIHAYHHTNTYYKQSDMLFYVHLTQMYILCEGLGRARILISLERMQFQQQTYFHCVLLFHVHIFLLSGNFLDYTPKMSLSVRGIAEGAAENFNH